MSSSSSSSCSSSPSLVIFITGANQGVGYACVEELISSHPTSHLLLGSRSVSSGLAAVSALRQKFGESAKNVEFLQIDVTDRKSIIDSISTISRKFGRLDILIQNAAMDYDLQSAKRVLGTNLFGLIDLSDAALPLLRRSSSPHVVIVSSAVGSWASFSALEPLRSRLSGEVNATDDEVREIANDFFSVVEKREKKEAETGREVWLPQSSAWWHGVYGASKAILNVHARSFAKRHVDWLTTSIVTPGYCATNMNEYQGPRSVQVGAKSMLNGLKIPRGDSGKWLLRDDEHLPWAFAAP